MKTKIVRITEENQEEAIKQAGKVIREGGIVAFPTETVYGLGANALDPEAVQKIFTAKGRPQDNPLIVHVSSKDISAYVEEIPMVAQRLMDKFWPGPLTIILKKSSIIPDVTSANLNTVGLRMPKQKIALRLIEESQVPIAAPSANRSGKPSPTTLEHCVRDLDGRVDVILGGDISDVGIESTIVDCTVEPPVVLRPGGISLELLQQVDSRITIDPHLVDATETPKAPGMKYRHYAPKAPLHLVDHQSQMIETIQRFNQTYQAQGKKVGILATDETKMNYQSDFIYSLGSRRNLEVVGQRLYYGLRQMDEKEVDVILCETFPEEGIGRAIMNRLRKASVKE